MSNMHTYPKKKGGAYCRLHGRSKKKRKRRDGKGKNNFNTSSLKFIYMLKK
jgi:hypothetical protein